MMQIRVNNMYGFSRVSRLLSSESVIEAALIIISEVNKIINGSAITAAVKNPLSE